MFHDIQMETIRLLFALTTRYNLDIHVVDVIGAYLDSKLDKEIYMQQPELYHDRTTHVWKLNKALYGLKPSDHIWNFELNIAFPWIHPTSFRPMHIHQTQ
jgi:hypothetical protein